MESVNEEVDFWLDHAIKVGIMKEIDGRFSLTTKFKTFILEWLIKLGEEDTLKLFNEEEILAGSIINFLGATTELEWNGLVTVVTAQYLAVNKIEEESRKRGIV